jgi:hypothetical protein
LIGVVNMAGEEWGYILPLRNIRLAMRRKARWHLSFFYRVPLLKLPGGTGIYFAGNDK